MLTRMKKLHNPLTLSLALVAGAGLTLMMVALGVGVVQGEAANSGLIGGLFLFGLILLVLGFIGWLVAVQPYKHFDDINVPKDTGHHGHDEHAIVPAESHAVEPHGASHP